MHIFRLFENFKVLGAKNPKLKTIGDSDVVGNVISFLLTGFVSNLL